MVSPEERARLDPYSRIAESKDVPLLQRIAGRHLVVVRIPSLTPGSPRPADSGQSRQDRDAHHS